MSTKTALIILVIAAIVIGGYIILFGMPEPESEKTEEVTTSGFRAENNAVAAQDQQPGSSVIISQVVLENAGYVVIHENSNGTPGTVLGSSMLLSEGQTDNVTVELSRQTQEGETLFAMLHVESNNNSSFELSTDGPVMSVLGGPIMGTFIISADAQPGVISL